MIRLPLACSLFLLASHALAGPVAADTDAASTAKGVKVVAVDPAQESDAAETVTATAAPARNTAPRGVSPRWRSLLPGMIR